MASADYHFSDLKLELAAQRGRQLALDLIGGNAGRLSEVGDWLLEHSAAIGGPLLNKYRAEIAEGVSEPFDQQQAYITGHHIDRAITAGNDLSVALMATEIVFAESLRIAAEGPGS